MLVAVLAGPCRDLAIRERIGVPMIIVLLVVFIGVGIDAVLRPKRHMNSYLKRGGEMLRDLNETGVQFVGLLFAGASGWMLYSLLRSVWERCFG